MKVSNSFLRKKALIHPKLHNNKKDLTFVPSVQIDYIREDNSYIPRFSVNKKYHEIFQKFPINKELKYSSDLISSAIQYGLILLLQYKGEDDEFMQGHSRVIYPMVLGRSQDGKELLRAYHLKGWSVSKGANIEKEWRLFRADRILSMSFTGQFFRLAPEGYNTQDESMKGAIIRKADFNEIRNNQSRLLTNNVIQNQEDVEIEKIDSIAIDKTDTQLDLTNPFENLNIAEKDKSYIRLTFLKKVGTNDRIAVLGALGKPGNRVRTYANNNFLGIYDVERSVMGTLLGNSTLLNVSGYSLFDLYVFLHKK